MIFFLVMFLLNVLMPFHIYYGMLLHILPVAAYLGTWPLAYVVKGLLLLLMLGPFGYFATAHENYHVSLVTIFATLFAILVLLFFSSIFFQILRLILSMFFDSEKMKFFGYGYLVIVFFYIFTALIEGGRFPEVKEVGIRLKGFGEKPYRIAVLADMHLGPILRTEFAKEVVTKVNEQEVDLVVIPGDLIDKRSEFAPMILEPLKDLKAKDGVYFSLGNHEYYRGDIPKLVETLKQLGIPSLLNVSVYIGDVESGFNLGGMNDLQGLEHGVYLPDFKKIKEGIKNDRPLVLLAHRPKRYFHSDSRVALQISGHTHGGQIFPFQLFSWLGNARMLAGLYKMDDGRQVYVTRGTGYWGPPVRLFSPSEITILSIQKE